MQSFDTHAAVKSLEAAGIATPAAEMIVKNILDSRNFDISNFITKDKFSNLQAEMQTKLAKKTSAAQADTTLLKNDFEWIKENMVTKAELSEVRTEIAEIKAELKVELANTKAELIKEISSNIKWMIGLMIAQTTILIGLAKFFLHF